VTGDELLHRAKRRRVVSGVLGQQRLQLIPEASQPAAIVCDGRAATC
jgi:hypothetical protein